MSVKCLVEFQWEVRNPAPPHEGSSLQIWSVHRMWNLLAQARGFDADKCPCLGRARLGRSTGVIFVDVVLLSLWFVVKDTPPPLPPTGDDHVRGVVMCMKAGLINQGAWKYKTCFLM